MSRWIFSVFLLPMLLSAAENLTDAPGLTADCTVEAYYYPGNTVEDTGEKVERSGMFTEKELTGIRFLFDGDRSANRTVATRFWSQQEKKISIVMDFKVPCRIGEITVAIPSGSGSWPQSCTVKGSLGGTAPDQWQQLATENNPYKYGEKLPEVYDFVLHPPEGSLARFVKVELHQGPTAPYMAVSELKISGERLPDYKVQIPKAVRFEPESAQGVTLAGSGTLGNSIWSSEEHFRLKLPPDMPEKNTLFIKYMDNGERTLEAECGGVRKKMPYNPQSRWIKFGECSGHDLALSLKNIGKYSPAVDSLLFSADPDYDPDKTETAILLMVPVIQNNPEFAEGLFREHPDIPPEEFARCIVEHYKMKPPKAPARFTDQNGAILWRGKPIFPVAFYHAGQNDPRLADVPLNAFMDSPDRKSGDKRIFASIVSYHATGFAYDKLARLVAENAAHPNLLMRYICDEPENSGVSPADLKRMNAVVKAVDPSTPTLVNISASAAGNGEYLTVCDYVGVDDYPVPQKPVHVITASVDKARFHSGGRPVIFVPQTFDWGGYGQENSRWPTPDEISVMTFLAVIHGARGIWFYEFPAPAIGSDKYIKDFNPEAWERILQIITVLRKTEPELTGPEAPFPGSVQTTQNGHIPPEIRFAVSADKSRCTLFIVNPAESPAEMILKWAVPGIKTETLFNSGIEITGNNRIKLKPFASAVLRVSGIPAAEIRTLSAKQALSAVQARLQKK